jgi:hypothetical protein
MQSLLNVGLLAYMLKEVYQKIKTDERVAIAAPEKVTEKIDFQQGRISGCYQTINAVGKALRECDPKFNVAEFIDKASGHGIYALDFQPIEEKK